jgi:ketosteroid isomerase-like protein
VSQQTVDIVRDAMVAWNQQDWDAVLATLDPEVDWRLSGSIPDLATEYHGHEGVRSFWNSWTASWAQLRVEVEEIVDLDERVMMLGHFRAEGRGEIELNQPIAFLFTFRDGLVTHFQSYWNRAEALAVIGRE